jgi:hypothetical protein
MKQFIYILLLSITFISVEAQNKISFTTTVGTGISMDISSSMSFTWQVLGNYSLTERLSFGAGTGMTFYEKMLIPVYGNIKYQFGRERKFTPYAEFAAGYSFAPSKNATGGIFMNPSFGIQYPMKNKKKLQLAIGYELQKLELLKKQTDNYFHKEFKEQLSHPPISVRIGLSF